jgi:hypothetical protein
MSRQGRWAQYAIQSNLHQPKTLSQQIQLRVARPGSLAFTKLYLIEPASRDGDELAASLPLEKP